MDRQSLIFFVGLAASIALSCILITAQPRGAQLNAKPTPLASTEDQAASQRQQEADDIRAITSILSSIQQEQARAEQQRADDESQGFFEHLIWSSGPSNWALAIFAAFAAGIGIKTLGAIQREVSVTSDALTTNKDIERAYITMSHAPPGIYGDHLLTQELDRFNDVIPPEEEPSEVSVSIGIKITNDGNTPAVVEATLLTLFRANGLPVDPPYELGRREEKFVSLTKGSSFHIFEHHPFGTAILTEILLGSPLKLYVIGYVDYRDKFRRRHRCGYARVFSPEANRESSYEGTRSIFGRRTFKNRNNLPYITQDGYNYDIEIDEKGNPKG